MDNEGFLQAASARCRDMARLRGLGLLPSSGSFFPSVHYPPITMYPPLGEQAWLQDYSPPDDGRYVLYAHIPFCPSRCTFCHYPVSVGPSELMQETYVDLLARELDIWLDRLGLRRIPARSVLIAGGTPTALTPRMFRRFHEELTRRVDLGGCTQLAYDVDPHTLLGAEGTERLRIMRDHGSERLTIGIQSFDDDTLRHMNRRHDSAGAVESIRQCRRAGYEDICAEFIFGYPHQTPQAWLDTLRAAIATGVEEIQLYRLKIEAYGDAPGPIGRLFQKQPEIFPSVESATSMKQAGTLLLAEHGYHENLTRVFTRSPDLYSHYAADQCCHLRDCIGVGLSAFSSLRDRFAINTPSMERYAAAIAANELPVVRGLVRSRDDQLRWHAVLPLKNWWIDKRLYQQRTGERVEEVFRREWQILAAHDLVNDEGEHIRFTPLGRFFADEICVQFHHPAYQPFAPSEYAEGPLALARPDLMAG